MAIEIDFTEIAELQEKYKSCKSLKETYALADVLNEKYGIADAESYPILSGVYSLSNIISVLNKANPKTECVTKTSALVTPEDIAYVSAAQSKVRNLTVPEFCALVSEFKETKTMTSVREIVGEYIFCKKFETVKGSNGRFVQNQGRDASGNIAFALYDKNGNPTKLTSSVEIALDYIGLKERECL